jgi:hypothetical protein
LYQGTSVVFDTVVVHYDAPDLPFPELIFFFSDSIRREMVEKGALKLLKTVLVSSAGDLKAESLKAMLSLTLTGTPVSYSPP